MLFESSCMPAAVSAAYTEQHASEVSTTPIVVFQNALEESPEIESFPIGIQIYSKEVVRISVSQYLQIAMISQGTCSLADFAITVQVFIHDVTGCPLRAHCILSSFRQRSQVCLHFFIAFGYADGFISPNKSILVSWQIGVDGQCLVVRIRVNHRDLI